MYRIAIVLILVLFNISTHADERNSTCTKVFITNPDGTVIMTSECVPPAEPDSRHTASQS